MDATIADFATLARRVSMAAQSSGLRSPAFRCPPRLAVNRTVRRMGSMTIVAVRVRGRTVDDVLGDLIEGILVTNEVPLQDASAFRSSLLAAANPSNASTSKVA